MPTSVVSTFFISSISTTTTGTAATWLNWSPAGIMQLATVGAAIAGGSLSVVLIYIHWRKGRIEYKKTMLEMKIMLTIEKERAEHAKQAKRRKEDGE